MDTCSKDTIEKNKKNKPLASNNNYLLKYKKFLEIEGGLSSDPDDRYNTKVKYHTNKGVRWETFKMIHKTASYRDFLTMNDSLYYGVIKYHERVVKTLYTGSNKSITLFLIEELWASGHLSNYKNLDFNNPDIINTLYYIKERRYKRLLARKPHLSKYKKGWRKRRKNFKQFNKQFNTN